MTVYIEGFGKITATQNVLNEISIMAGECAKWNDENGYHALASDYKDVSDRIYEALDEQGVYDGFKR